jgi:hypothetical protein
LKRGKRVCVFQSAEQRKDAKREFSCQLVHEPSQKIESVPRAPAKPLAGVGGRVGDVILFHCFCISASKGGWEVSLSLSLSLSVYVL